MSTMTTRRTTPSTGQKVGLVLAGLMSAANIPSVLIPTPEGEEGPPMEVLAVGTVLGVVGLVAVIAAWRGNSVAARIAAVAIIIVTLTGLPAFFVDGIPAGIRILVGVSIVWTVAAVYLMFAAPRRGPASDEAELR
ncbi:hypothetical protein [Nocardioides speluncae]|uniref:hypothetical protein n=1 Tax=Nocardioides speluncae TaxID=2670337 RepID=UPI000D68D5FA|nr:hypothetical protein [Nocardioides speluncae]